MELFAKELAILRQRSIILDELQIIGVYDGLYYKILVLEISAKKISGFRISIVSSIGTAPGQLAYALGKLLGGPVVDACGGAKSLVAILVHLGSENGANCAFKWEHHRLSIDYL